MLYIHRIQQNLMIMMLMMIVIDSSTDDDSYSGSNKTIVPIVVTLVGIVTAVSDVHSEKA